MSEMLGLVVSPVAAAMIHPDGKTEADEWIVGRWWENREPREVDGVPDMETIATGFKSEEEARSFADNIVWVSPQSQKDPVFYVWKDNDAKFLAHKVRLGGTSGFEGGNLFADSNGQTGIGFVEHFVRQDSYEGYRLLLFQFPVGGDSKLTYVSLVKDGRSTTFTTYEDPIAFAKAKIDHWNQLETLIQSRQFTEHEIEVLHWMSNAAIAAVEQMGDWDGVDDQINERAYDLFYEDDGTWKQCGRQVVYHVEKGQIEASVYCFYPCGDEEFSWDDTEHCAVADPKFEAWQTEIEQRLQQEREEGQREYAEWAIANGKDPLDNYMTDADPNDRFALSVEIWTIEQKNEFREAMSAACRQCQESGDEFPEAVDGAVWAKYKGCEVIVSLTCEGDKYRPASYYCQLVDPDGTPHQSEEYAVGDRCPTADLCHKPVDTIEKLYGAQLIQRQFPEGFATSLRIGALVYEYKVRYHCDKPMKLWVEDGEVCYVCEVDGVTVDAQEGVDYTVRRTESESIEDAELEDEDEEDKVEPVRIPPYGMKRTAGR